MTTTDVGRIQYLSTPARVSMGDEWYGIAGLDHFWIRRRFEMLCRMGGDSIRQATAIADIGCGHGVLQRQIEDHFQQSVTGFDLNEEGLKQTLSRTSPVCCYNLLEKKTEYQGRFDLILLFDVLEHLSDEDSFVSAIRFHLNPTGKLLLNVPAFQLLWSNYDRAQGHFRRYTIGALREIAERNQMKVRTWTYWGLPLTPLLLLRKLWLLGRSDDKVITSAGFASPISAVNRLLLSLSRWEPIPQHVFGSSLMAVLEKQTEG